MKKLKKRQKENELITSYLFKQRKSKWKFKKSFLTSFPLYFSTMGCTNQLVLKLFSLLYDYYVINKAQLKNRFRYEIASKNDNELLFYQ